MATKRLISVEFEVFGKVQGVFFRKFTNETATKLGLVGWVQNTPRDTVVGTIQGEENAVKSMKEWLSKTGSPKSKIDRCQFKNERLISDSEYTSFGIEPGNDKKKKKSTTGTKSKKTAAKK